MDLTWNWYEETDATKIIERLKWLEGKRVVLATMEGPNRKHISPFVCRQVTVGVITLKEGEYGGSITIDDTNGDSITVIYLVSPVAIHAKNNLTAQIMQQNYPGHRLDIMTVI